MYSIGEVAEMFDLSIPTLRFYDKEGLLLDLEREASGIRKFNDKTIEALRVIECLKKSGMQIKEIKEFMHWCSLGDTTIKKRKDMFLARRTKIENEMKELEKALNMIEYKCWYYDEALKDGTEKRVKTITFDELPTKVKTFYIEAHK